MTHSRGHECPTWIADKTVCLAMALEKQFVSAFRLCTHSDYVHVTLAAIPAQGIGGWGELVFSNQFLQSGIWLD
jgi:hypothetical protein